MCSQISLAEPKFGVSYRGTVRNDDYKLRLTIPDGFTGWGADPVAPFHGFTIFLPSTNDRSSCIVFEIYLRVDLREREHRPPGATVMIGDVVGWKEEAADNIKGTDVTNVTIRFAVAHGQDVHDGSVRLIAPTKNISRSKPLFDSFISQMRFYRH